MDPVFFFDPKVAQSKIKRERVLLDCVMATAAATIWCIVIVSRITQYREYNEMLFVAICGSIVIAAFVIITHIMAKADLKRLLNKPTK
jgi:hypothetical protein